MVALLRRFNLLGDVGRELHPDAAGQGGLPLDQLPLAVLPTIPAHLHESALQLDLGSEQVFPLVPSCVPNDWHGRLVEHDLKFSPRVAVECAVVVEIEPAQGRAEAAFLLFGQERQNSRGEERLAIARAISGYQNRTKAAIGKECRYRRIL